VRGSTGWGPCGGGQAGGVGDHGWWWGGGLPDATLWRDLR
jgi:hypothetical protein